MNMERKPRILLIEDEHNLGATLKERLEIDAFEVRWTRLAEEAEQEIDSYPFDLALVDVGLPDGNGFEIAEMIKKKQPRMALIFLTAFSSPEDRVRGLELGAEDYVVKPFHVKELILRIQNGLKRARFAAGADTFREPLEIGKAKVYFSKFEIHSAEETHSLSHKEWALLRLLYDRRGKAVSRDDILNFVWGNLEYPTPRTIDNFVLRLRKLIEDNPDQPRFIKSVRGVGYLLSEEGE